MSIVHCPFLIDVQRIDVYKSIKYKSLIDFQMYFIWFANTLFCANMHQYVLRNAGGDESRCPAGTEVPESECLEAAKTFSSIADTKNYRTVEYDFSPCGCYLWKNPYKTYWVSRYDSGEKGCKSSSQARLICLRDHPGVSGYALGVDDARNYWLAYGIDIPNLADFDSSAGVPYSEDYSDVAALSEGFTRVGYYLELKDDNGAVQWVWVSFDAFTDDIKKIGFPTVDSGAIFQEAVTNMNVASSIPSLNAAGITGNIEFWPHKHNKHNAQGVPGASDTVYDLGDERLTDCCYGSMQVHSSELGGTIFAINRWLYNSAVDIGIGNNPNGNPDWTYAANGLTYTTKRLEVFVDKH